jgi:hypothetical protein
MFWERLVSFFWRRRYVIKNYELKIMNYFKGRLASFFWRKGGMGL